MLKLQHYIFVGLFSILLLGNSTSGTAQNYQLIIDSLIQQNDTTAVSSQKVALLNAIAFNHRRLKPDSMLHYAKEAYQMARLIADRKGEAMALKHLGIAHYKKASSMDTIVRYYKDAILIAEEIEDYYTQAACNNNIGLAYMQQYEFDHSLDFFLEALDIFNTKIKTPHYLKALILGNSGTIYAMQEEYERALNYLEESLQFAEEHGFERVKVLYLDNLGAVLYELGRDKEALQIMEDALVLQRGLGDVQSSIQTLVAYAHILWEENDLEAAKVKAQEGYKLAQAKNQKIEICKALDVLSQIEFKEGNIEQALIYARQGLETADEIKNLRFQIDALRTLISIYKGNADFESALLFTNRMQLIEDSTRTELVKAKDLQTKYNLIERTRQLDSLRTEGEYQKKESKLQLEQDQTRNLLIIASLLAALVSLILFWSVYHNRKLKDKNRQLEIARQEAEEARQEAEEASRIKQEFLATMSHEIRTPMNAVIGFTDILLEESPKEEQIPMLKNLKTSGKHLMNLINDILDLSKLEAQKIELERIPFDLKALLQELITIFQITKEKEELELFLEWQGTELPRYVIGDSVRLTQILSNLISNAIKFTSKGKVILRIIVKEGEGNQQHLRFEIEDTGIGIPKEKQALIFDNFSQVSSSTTREFGGTGLGLAITRQLLELQGSYIELESELGKGSIFGFDLNLELGGLLLSEKVKNQFDYKTNRLDDTRILLVEDNIFNQKIAEKILTKLGATVHIAEDGIAAIEKVKEESYDLILMDIYMPRLNGFEAIIQIRTLPINTPIIALTAEVTNQTIQKLKDMNVPYISKPFQPKKLYETIKSELTRS